VDLQWRHRRRYVVFARTGEAAGARGISAFIVDAGTPGFEIAERIQVIAPHPLARLRFTNCRIPASSAWCGGRGLQDRDANARRLSHVGGRGCARLARCALDSALHRATTRKMFNQTLADFQLTQAKLAQMATTIDSSACSPTAPRGSATKGGRSTREAAMAKMTATEGAQQVIDAAVQMWGGLGVVSEQRSSASTARSARCASTRARPRSSS